MPAVGGPCRTVSHSSGLKSVLPVIELLLSSCAPLVESGFVSCCTAYVPRGSYFPREVFFFGFGFWVVPLFLSALCFCFFAGIFDLLVPFARSLDPPSLADVLNPNTAAPTLWFVGSARHRSGE